MIKKKTAVLTGTPRATYIDLLTKQKGHRGSFAYAKRVEEGIKAFLMGKGRSTSQCAKNSGVKGLIEASQFIIGFLSTRTIGRGGKPEAKEGGNFEKGTVKKKKSLQFRYLGREILNTSSTERIKSGNRYEREGEE